MTECMNFSDILPKIGDIDDRGTGWKTIYASEGEFSDIIFKSDNTEIDYTSSENIKSLAKCHSLLNSNLAILKGFEILLRRDHTTLVDKMKLMTVGKDFARFVGPGMLTGIALLPSDILICLRQLWEDGCAGILGIVTEEYMMDFGVAAERARCEGMLVDLVTVHRLAAPLVIKYAGAMAQAGFNMKVIYVSLRKLVIDTAFCHLNENKAVVSCTHNPLKLIEMQDFREAVSSMLNIIMSPTEGIASYVLMLNSFTQDRQFLYVVAREVAKQAAERRLDLRRLIAGQFLPGTHGFSLSLLVVDKEMVAMIDSMDHCQMWPRLVYRTVPAIVPGPPNLPRRPPLQAVGPSLHEDFTEVPVLFCCRVLICSKNLLNEVDVKNVFGDQLIPAVDVLLKKIHSEEIILQRPFNVLNSISHICESYINNEYGDLFGFFFSGAAQALLRYTKESEIEWHMLTEALALGSETVKTYTSFQERRFCFIDVIEEFRNSLENLMKAEDSDLIKSLGCALEEAQKKLEYTYDIECPEKKMGLPEVSMQATLVLLIAIVEGIKVAHVSHYPPKLKRRKFIPK